MQKKVDFVVRAHRPTNPSFSPQSDDDDVFDDFKWHRYEGLIAPLNFFFSLPLKKLDSATWKWLLLLCSVGLRRVRTYLLSDYVTQYHDTTTVGRAAQHFISSGTCSQLETSALLHAIECMSKLLTSSGIWTHERVSYLYIQVCVPGTFDGQRYTHQSYGLTRIHFSPHGDVQLGRGRAPWPGSGRCRKIGATAHASPTLKCVCFSNFMCGGAKTLSGTGNVSHGC